MVSSHVVYFPVYLHVVPVMNSTALSPNRPGDGGGGHLNNPVTAVAQTEAVDRREGKIAENKKRPEQGPCMYSTAEVGEGARVGGRDGDFKWWVGGRGGGASPILISRCPFSFPANPETQPQPHVMQQAAKEPPVSLKLMRAIKSSFASEVASLDAFRYEKRNALVYLGAEKGRQPPPLALTLHAHQFLRQPASQSPPARTQLTQP